jgi:hypothetical protein
VIVVAEHLPSDRHESVFFFLNWISGNVILLLKQMLCSGGRRRAIPLYGNDLITINRPSTGKCCCDYSGIALPLRAKIFHLFQRTITQK